MTRTQRAWVAVAVYALLGIGLLLAFAPPSIWIGFLLGLAAIVGVWIAVWGTLSWVEDGDPRWWRQ